MSMKFLVRLLLLLLLIQNNSAHLSAKSKQKHYDKQVRVANAHLLIRAFYFANSEINKMKHSDKQVRVANAHLLIRAFDFNLHINSLDAGILFPHSKMIVHIFTYRHAPTPSALTSESGLAGANPCAVLGSWGFSQSEGR